MALTITSANAVFMLGISSVFPVPQRLQGFGVDEAFDTEPTEISEVRLGVDSVGVAGWVPRLVKITVTLLPSSPSFLLFENWVTAMDNINEILYANCTIVIPSIGRKYTGAQGSLTRYPPLPNVRKTLMDRQFEITWMPQGLGRPALSQAPA
jgi:hypothetical protein